MRRSSNAGYVVVLTILILLGASRDAGAAAGTAGGVFGRVVDKDSGQAVLGATVVARGPQGDDATLTDAEGRYEFRELPAGSYVVRFFRGSATLERTAAVLVDQTVRVDARMPATGEAVQSIVVVEQAAPVDVGSSRVGITLNQEFAQSVPTGLHASEFIQKTPGAFQDPVGLSLSGGTGAENVYYLDGLNVTGLGQGLLGTDVFVPFMDQVEVASAGYGAEYGRALGGLVNMTTKSGSNQWHGSAFSYLSPGGLSGSPRRIYSRATSLTGTTQLDYSTTTGAEVGGPILKDRLFFWVGYAPEIEHNRLVQHADRLVDRDGDGVADSNPDGSPVTEPLYSKDFAGKNTTHHYAGKLTWRLRPEHNLTVGLYGTHSNHEYMRGANMDYVAGMSSEITARNDVTARWLSSFFDRRWRLEVNLGLHRERYIRSTPFDEARNSPDENWYANASGDMPALTDFNASPSVAAACAVTASGFQPCPALGYQSGGYGTFRDITASRWAGQLKNTFLFHGAGLHELKVGADYEFVVYEDARWNSGMSGSARSIWHYPGETDELSFFRLNPGERLSMFSDVVDPSDPYSVFRLAPGEARYRDMIDPRTTALNSALFVQDSYSPLTNLTVNAGLRWETQRLSDYNGDTILTLKDMLAPRIGVVYDPTNSGRAKIFGHFGRYYESIPMQLASRAFGGEGIVQVVKLDDGTQQVIPIAGDAVRVQNGIKGAYNNEVVAGAQYAIRSDLVVGATFVHRWLGRAIEDTGGDDDNPAPSLLANPGGASADEVKRLQERAARLQGIADAPGATDADKAAAADARADANAASGPAPERTYTAVQLMASKRFGHNWFFSGSYTWSRLRGNYTGLYSADNDQRDPNLTTQFDVVSAMANRYGALPNDRPHLIHADGSYAFVWGRSTLVTGLGFVGQSGQPLTPLGRSQVLGGKESFILPRGSAGRTPFVTRFDLHLAYRTKLAGKATVEAFIDIFNLFNQRAVLTQDQEFTVDAVAPLPPGSNLSDATASDGNAVQRNPNYLAATSYQAPIAGRLGLRVMF
jgi:hypothetical protein